jgi:NDP-sugar pyrophosphorylase family protein
VLNAELARRLGVQAQPNTRFDNFLHESVQLGSKTTVAAGCMVGRGTTMGDKCSIKRSVLGPSCKLGSGVKIINCVLMDGVVVEDHCHLQNSIVCSGAHLQARFRHTAPVPCLRVAAVLVLGGILPEQSELRPPPVTGMLSPQSCSCQQGEFFGRATTNGRVVQENTRLRDCQVGPNYRVAGSEHQEEVLAKAQPRRSTEFK